MKLALSLPRSQYAVGEDLVASLVLENDSAAPLEVPDPFNAYNWEPKYTVVGPAHPAGFTFSFRSAALEDPRPHPSSVAPVLTTIAPGGRVDGDLPLHQWLPLTEPGSYELVARMEWNGATAVSAPVTFVVEPYVLVSASLGVDVGVPESRDIWVTWVRRAASAREIGDAIFLEVRPDLGEVERHLSRAVATVGPGARDALTPWTNYDRKSELAFWRVWREGQNLLALHAGETQPHAAYLGSAAFACIRPSLMASDGALRVFAFETAGQGLMHVRFTRGAAPVVVRGPGVPGLIVGGGCALPDRTAAGGSPHVLVVSDDNGEVAVHCANLEVGDAFGPLGGVALPGLQVIPASVPAVRVDRVDGVHAVLLLRDKREPDRLVRADVRVPPAHDVGGDVEVKVTRVGSLPREPRSARAVYRASGDPDPHVDWAVLLEDDTMITSTAESPFHVGAAPVVPLEIVSLTQTAYVLASDASGLRLVALLR